MAAVELPPASIRGHVWMYCGDRHRARIESDDALFIWQLKFSSVRCHEVCISSAAVSATFIAVISLIFVIRLE